jgi:FKBP-type peptidyl-prolyl cis-trans isomerase
VLGDGKVIKAMELAVSSMKVGERALVACRADYGYGSDGLRTTRGDILVPPFSTLCFDIKLVSAA